MSAQQKRQQTLARLQATRKPQAPQASRNLRALQSARDAQAGTAKSVKENTGKDYEAILEAEKKNPRCEDW